MRLDRQKLIIILVGLPGRGKTFLCNKLMCYLNWWEAALACCHYQTLCPRIAGWPSNQRQQAWHAARSPHAPHRCLAGSSVHKPQRCRRADGVYCCCRLGHTTHHFNVGNYRRKQKGDEETQDAAFFDHSNQVAPRIAPCTRLPP